LHEGGKSRGNGNVVGARPRPPQQSLSVVLLVESFVMRAERWTVPSIQVIFYLAKRATGAEWNSSSCKVMLVPLGEALVDARPFNAVHGSIEVVVTGLKA